MKLIGARNSNEISWLAQIDHASVKLATEDPFGHIISGVITMTGRLGFFRRYLKPADETIDLELAVLDSQTPEAQGNAPNAGLSKDTMDCAGTLTGTTGRISASWDALGKYDMSRDIRVKRYQTYTERDIVADAHSPNIICLPIRGMHELDGSALDLAGLLLAPTGNDRGQYRRIGMFTCDRWMLEDACSFDYMTSSTDIVDEGFFISKHGSGDGAEYTISIV